MSKSTVVPSAHILRGWPGPTQASLLRVRELLEKDSREHHIFERNNIFHNHLSHHLLAAFSLGAPASLLDKIYANSTSRLVPLDPVERDKVHRELDDGKKTKLDVPVIDHSNWTSYTGVQDAYARYLTFFANEIAALGEAKVLEKYLFSSEANAGGEANKTGPRMLIRLVAGVLHPIIHVGFGAEFSDKVMLAEGLAETAVHGADAIAALFPSNWPYGASDGLEGLPSSSVDSLATGVSNLVTSSKGEKVSTLEVYAQFCASDKIRLPPYDADKLINTRLKDSIAFGNAEELRRLASLWSLGDDEEGWLDRRTEELMILGTLLAGATGRQGREVRVDFFLMHVLTSSLHVPSVAKLLEAKAHQKVLLKTYFLAVLHTALARGRPHIDASLPMAHSSFPTPPPSSSSRGKRREGNPWTDIVGEVVFAPDPHTLKSIRTLLHLGSQPHLALLGVGELPGATSSTKTDLADGTLFVRTAGLVMNYMGWSGGEEGRDKGWDRSALGWDEAWETEARG